MPQPPAPPLKPTTVPSSWFHLGRDLSPLGAGCPVRVVQVTSVDDRVVELRVQDLLGGLHTATDPAADVVGVTCPTPNRRTV